MKEGNFSATTTVCSHIVMVSYIIIYYDLHGIRVKETLNMCFGGSIVFGNSNIVE